MKVAEGKELIEKDNKFISQWKYDLLEGNCSNEDNISANQQTVCIPCSSYIPPDTCYDNISMSSKGNSTTNIQEIDDKINRRKKETLKQKIIEELKKIKETDNKMKLNQNKIQSHIAHKEISPSKTIKIIDKPPNKTIKEPVLKCDNKNNFKDLKKEILETEKVLCRGINSARELKQRVEKLEKKPSSVSVPTNQKLENLEILKPIESVSTSKISERHHHSKENTNLKKKAKTKEPILEVKNPKLKHLSRKKIDKSSNELSHLCSTFTDVCHNCHKKKHNTAIINITHKEKDHQKQRNINLQKLPNLEIRSNLKLPRIPSKEDVIAPQNTAFKIFSYKKDNLKPNKIKNVQYLDLRRNIEQHNTTEINLDLSDESINEIIRHNESMIPGTNALEYHYKNQKTQLAPLPVPDPQEENKTTESKNVPIAGVLDDLFSKINSQAIMSESKQIDFESNIDEIFRQYDALNKVVLECLKTFAEKNNRAEIEKLSEGGENERVNKTESTKYSKKDKLKNNQLNHNLISPIEDNDMNKVEMIWTPNARPPDTVEVIGETYSSKNTNQIGTHSSKTQERMNFVDVSKRKSSKPLQEVDKMSEDNSENYQSDDEVTSVKQSDIIKRMSSSESEKARSEDDKEEEIAGRTEDDYESDFEEDSGVVNKDESHQYHDRTEHFTKQSKELFQTKQVFETEPSSPALSFKAQSLTNQLTSDVLNILTQNINDTKTTQNKLDQIIREVVSKPKISKDLINHKDNKTTKNSFAQTMDQKTSSRCRRKRIPIRKEQISSQVFEENNINVSLEAPLRNTTEEPKKFEITNKGKEPEPAEKVENDTKLERGTTQHEYERPFAYPWSVLGWQESSGNLLKNLQNSRKNESNNSRLSPFRLIPKLIGLDMDSSDQSTGSSEREMVRKHFIRRDQRSDVTTNSDCSDGELNLKFVQDRNFCDNQSIGEVLSPPSSTENGISSFSFD